MSYHAHSILCALVGRRESRVSIKSETESAVLWSRQHWLSDSGRQVATSGFQSWPWLRPTDKISHTLGHLSPLEVSDALCTSCAKRQEARTTSLARPWYLPSVPAVWRNRIIYFVRKQRVLIQLNPRNAVLDRHSGLQPIYKFRILRNPDSLPRPQQPATRLHPGLRESSPILPSYFIIIPFYCISSAPLSSKWTLYSWSMSINIMHVLLFSRVRATCSAHLSFPFYSLIILHLVRRIRHESHHEISSIPLLLPPSEVQIFSSTPYSRKPSVCVPPSLRQTKSHTRTKQQAELQFCTFQSLNVIK